MYIVAATNKVDILCLTETWLNDNFSPVSINIPGYSIVRRDRREKIGGSVLIAIRKNWNYSVIEISEEFESIWILLRNAKMPRFISHVAVAAICHRPGANNYDLKKHILSVADKIIAKHSHCLLMITGDFNQFKDSLITFFPFKQLVKFITRGDATLDRIFTNV